MSTLGRLATLAAAMGAAAAFRGHGFHCYSHDEVRDGAIWIVDCHGVGITALEPLEYGEYLYRVEGSGAFGGEWSSRDARMSTIAVDLPPGARCDAASLERWARCLEVPRQFAWCGSPSTARFAGDFNFPSYAEAASDMARVARTCAPTNATARTLPPLRAYNERDVREAREARDQAELAAIGSLLGLWLCCGILCGIGGSKGRYKRVQRA